MYVDSRSINNSACNIPPISGLSPQDSGSIYQPGEMSYVMVCEYYSFVCSGLKKKIFQLTELSVLKKLHKLSTTELPYTVHNAFQGAF